jgi:PAT family beta-lactamase induction signal transducer AmpG
MNVNPASVGRQRTPWAWVPSLYLAEGIPYVVVMTVSVIFYKRMGISNTDIALFTSWLYLPWVIKPLWSPLVDLLKTRKLWIVAMQLLIGAGLAGFAFCIPLPGFFQWTLAFLWLLAFSSATHDIAADGFYMLGLTEHEQTFFTGIRSTFYRLAMITGQGVLIMLAGSIESRSGLPPVTLTVEAVAQAAAGPEALPASIQIEPQPGELRAVALPAGGTGGTLQIALAKPAAGDASATLAAARAWNRQKGFLPNEEQTAATSGKASTPSWWARTISGPLGAFLRKHCGNPQATSVQTGTAGNVGTVYFHLSKPPGRDVVLTFSWLRGDKSIHLVEGARLVFNDRNWNQPAAAVVQLDSKLREPTAAVFQARAGNLTLAWSATFLTLSALFAVLCLWHALMLPRTPADRPGEVGAIGAFLRKFLLTFASFFRKPRILALLGFLLFYRFAEAQLVKLVTPFLLDPREKGGLGLTTGEVGFVYGTVGIVALTVGGLLGGFAASRQGLKFWIWPMVCIIHVPDAAFVYLSYAQPDSLAVITACVAVEQFGYGFGFTAYMLYMLHIARGEHQTAHFALCTGFMALGMMIPGMFSGWLQEIIGYQHFFVWVLVATLPGFLVVRFIPLDPGFGRKSS